METQQISAVDKKEIAVISLSGGMDSTALLLHLLAQGIEVYAVSFDYGQKHRVELSRLQDNIQYLASMGFPVTWHILPMYYIGQMFSSSLLSGGDKIPEGHYGEENMKKTVVPNRNAIFSSIIYGYGLSLATKNFPPIPVKVCLGVHAGDHCFTRDTEILTPNGLRTVEELVVGDRVYSFNFESNIFEEDILTEIMKKSVVTSVLQIETQSGFLKLTDRHKVFRLKLKDFHPVWGYTKLIEEVLVRDLKVDDYLIQPTNLPYSDSDLKTSLVDIALKISKKYEKIPEIRIINDRFGIVSNNTIREELFLEKCLDLKDFVSILALYIAEGWCDKNLYKTVGTNSRFVAQFSQSIRANLDKVEYIINRLKDSQIPVKYEFSKELHNNIPKEVTFYFSNVMSLFMKECGSHSEVKNIPDWLWEILVSSQELREEFIRSITLGDGFSYNEQVKGFCTTSSKLFKQFITLIQLSGYHFSLSKPSGNTKYVYFSKKGKKQALITLGDAKFTKIKEIKEVQYDDYVYDLSIKKNHNFLAGDYGQHLISNSIYPDCRPEFYKKLHEVFREGNWDGSLVEFYTPYLHMNKALILQDAINSCLEMEIDFDIVFKNTNTCYNPTEDGKSCGKCGSCIERVEAFILHNKVDPIQYSEPWQKVVEHVVRVCEGKTT